MAKKINKKLALKKETLRSLSATELGGVAGGTLGSDKQLSVVKPPPPATVGCYPTEGCLLLTINNYVYYP